jgi:hypothetical protein
MLTIRHTIFKEKISGFDICNPESDVENVWFKRKTSLLDTAKEVYRTSKNHQWKKEIWRWKDKVDEAIKQRCTRFKTYKALDNESKSNEVEKAKAAYNESKRLAKSGR